MTATNIFYNFVGFRYSPLLKTWTASLLNRMSSLCEVESYKPEISEVHLSS